MADVTNSFLWYLKGIPELKKYDSILFLHQPMTSGQPLKIVQRHMAHPVGDHGRIPNKINWQVIHKA